MVSQVPFNWYIQAWIENSIQNSFESWIRIKKLDKCSSFYFIFPLLNVNPTTMPVGIPGQKPKYLFNVYNEAYVL